MQHICYRQETLYCEEIPLAELVEEFGTPLYVYSKQQILDNIHTMRAALGGRAATICYALKANSNPFILKMLAAEGLGADVVSAGELHLALKAGFPSEKIVFAGMGKREDEIEYALERNVFSFNVESFQELQSISLLALRHGKQARVNVRLNPDIDAESHPYITTGQKHNKFGIDASHAVEVFKNAIALPSITVAGIHVHIGSQILRPEPYRETALFLSTIAETLRQEQIFLEHLDIGGGFGVQYMNALTHEALPKESTADGVPASMQEFFDAMLPILEPLGCSLWIEPGRSIIANAGILATTVLYQKENSVKKFIIVDAGMNDLLRPSLYQAYHQIVPSKIETYEHEKVDVVGPLCETGDFLARDRTMPKVKRGDLLAVLTAGAYGFVTVSHYNGRPHPAEILVNGDKVRIIRERETFEHL